LFFSHNFFPPSVNDLLLLQIGKSVGNVVVFAVVAVVAVVVANTKRQNKRF